MTAFVTTRVLRLDGNIFFLIFFFLFWVFDYFTSTDLKYSVYTRPKIYVDFSIK